MAKKKRFFVLGPKASVFFDPQSQVKVLSQKDPFEYEGRDTVRIKIALANNHIRVLSDAEVKEYQDIKAEEVDLEEMTKKELIAHFKDSFEYSDEQLADFEKLKKDDMIARIEEWEKD